MKTSLAKMISLQKFIVHNVAFAKVEFRNAIYLGIHDKGFIWREKNITIYECKICDEQQLRQSFRTTHNKISYCMYNG